MFYIILSCVYNASKFNDKKNLIKRNTCLCKPVDRCLILNAKVVSELCFSEFEITRIRMV